MGEAVADVGEADYVVHLPDKTLGEPGNVSETHAKRGTQMAYWETSVALVSAV